MATVYNYVMKEIPKHMLDEIAISSTNIREAIIHGDVDTANKLLGYDFFFEGVVVDGDKLGRKLGYPTANLKMTDDEKIHLGDGIYAVYVEIRSQRSEVGSQRSEVGSQKSEGGSQKSEGGTQRSEVGGQKAEGGARAPVLKGMMSIGFRPTVDAKKRVIE